MATYTPQNVRVDRSTLFVGDTTTYPLRNVARTQLRTVRVHTPVPDPPGWPGPLMGISALAGGISLIITISSFSSDSGGFAVWSLLWVLVWGALFYLGFKESRKVRPKPKVKTLYVLDITTSGRPEGTLVADDEGELRMLSEAITDAIHDPKREYVSVINTYTFNSNDVVNVSGENVVGKVDGSATVNLGGDAT